MSCATSAAESSIDWFSPTTQPTARPLARRIVDRLVLADDAAQRLPDGPRAGFERRVGQHFGRLDGERGEGEEQREEGNRASHFAPFRNGRMLSFKSRS